MQTNGQLTLEAMYLEYADRIRELDLNVYIPAKLSTQTNIKRL